MDNIEYALTKIKDKTERLMARIDPQTPLICRAVSRNGMYTDKFETFFQPGWTHSFFLGNVAYMYLCFSDEKYLDYLKKCTGIYTDFLWHNDKEIGHDTGFLYSLYAVAMYKITGEDVYSQLALKAADEVAKRFRFRAGHIQAFYDLRQRGTQDDISFMIADDMMNMQILMWAYEKTGHSFYRDVYETHIQTAVRYLIRDDYSVCHAYNFDARTGNPVCEANCCGFSVGSHWARGTAWIIYGLCKACEFTSSAEKYLQPLIGTVNKYFECLGGDVIPPWDFRLPADAPERYSDGSAAAIAASAFTAVDGAPFDEYFSSKIKEYTEKVLKELTGDNWICPDDDEGIIYYGNGESCLWGDYFFTELVAKKYLKEKFIDFWN